MLRSGLVVTLMVLLAGCATMSRTEGVVGPVAWRATDLAVTEQEMSGQTRLVYSFALVLKETTGVGITFSHVSHALYEGSTGEQTGSWRLSQGGELTWRFSSNHGCGRNGETVPAVECGRFIAPRWRFVFSGTDDRGQAVRIVLDLRLPPQGPGK